MSGGTDRDRVGGDDPVEVGRVDDGPAGDGRIVDWERTGRRVRTSAAVIGGLVVLAWVVGGLAGDGIRLSDLGGWVGLGLGVMVVTEVVVVGGAAVRAERRAAVRGERLGSEDVGLLPPRPRLPSDTTGQHGSRRPDDSVDPVV